METQQLEQAESSQQEQRQEPVVIVVGAGATGLQCAKQLLQTRTTTTPNVIVLEARDRTGGRIYTTTTTSRRNEKELVMDHGAAWVHGTGQQSDGSSPSSNNPMMDLLCQSQRRQQSSHEAEESKLATVEMFSRTVAPGNPWMRPQSVMLKNNNLAVYQKGHLQETDNPTITTALDWHFTRMGCSELVQKGVSSCSATTSLRRALDEQQQPDDSDVRLWADFFLYLVECWYGSPAQQLQASEFCDSSSQDDTAYTDEGDFPGPHCTLTRGMEQLLTPLLTSVGHVVRLQHEVRRLAYDEERGKVKAVCNIVGSGGEKRETILEADIVVVTVSVGCLQHMCDCNSKRDSHNDDISSMFVPSLRPEKVKAISMFNTGIYKKVLLTFRSIWWPSEPPFISLMRSDPTTTSTISAGLGRYLLLDNLWTHRGMPSVEAILTGAAGMWAINRDDDEIRLAVLQFMQEALVGSRTSLSLENECIDCHVTRWEEDPFSRGAYSSVGLGLSSEQVSVLGESEWDGHLVFAGEATVPHYEGSVHGALFSGVEAAKKVICKFSGTPEFSGTAK